MYLATISNKRRLPGWLAMGGAALLTVMVLSIAVILLLQPGQQTRQNMLTAQATSTPLPATRPPHTHTVAYVPAMATHPPQPATTPRPQPIIASRPQPPVIPQPSATPQPPPQPKHKHKPDK
jgi:hypothetical protein